MAWHLPYYGRFNVLSKETRTDDSKDASTKCPQGPGSGHIVFNVLFKKQGQRIQKMLQRNVFWALGPDISFSSSFSNIVFKVLFCIALVGLHRVVP